MHRMEMALMVLTIAFVVIGGILWVLPPLVPNAPALSPVTGASVAASGVGRASNDSSSVASIIASNIFSPSRAAPRARYTPPGAEGEGEAAAVGTPPDQSVALLTPPPRVFGTMMGPGGATALMQPDSAGASGRLYREGDRVGAYRIVRISGSSVIVRGPSGRVELKIQPREDRTQ